jgi:hypothetical protein
VATKDEIIDALVGVIIGGRGEVVRENPNLGVPSFFEALEQDRKRGKKTRRKVSAAQKRYGRMFKKLAPKFKKKNGAWKKDGFKRCVKAAHKECRRKH